MDEFVEVFSQPHGIGEFWDNILLPSIVVGYFASVIHHLNVSTALFETFLFVAHYFLLTENIVRSLFLLFIETSCVIVAHMYNPHSLISCFSFASILLIWKTQSSMIGVHHPRIFLDKCMTLLLCKYALAAPEPTITLYWIAIVTYNYAFYFKRKSREDALLIMVIAGILFYFAFSMDADGKRSLFIIFLSVLLVLWLVKKHYYYQSLELNQHGMPEILAYLYEQP